MIVEVLIWGGVAVAVLVAAYALTMVTWHPERNVDRSRFGHWFRSLVRLYEDDAAIRIVQRSATFELAVILRGGEGHGCWAIVSCQRSDWRPEQLRSIREAVAGEPYVLILPDASEGGSGAPIRIQVAVPDIWSRHAADTIVRVAHRVLDVRRVSPSARFDLEFEGEHSTSRVLEVKRRQREGTLEEW